MRRSAGLPPGPAEPAPIQLARWTLTPTEFMDSCGRRFGDRFTVNLWGRPMVFLSNPADIKEVFRGSYEELCAGAANSMFKPALGHTSLLVLGGKKHLSRRRMMSPSFHGASLDEHADVIADIAERHISQWPFDEPFAVHPRTQDIALDAILMAVMGVADGPRADALRRTFRKLLEWTTEPPRLIMFALMNIHRPEDPRATRALRKVMDPVRTLLAAELADRRAAGDYHERGDVMSLLLASDDPTLDDAERIDQLLTMLVAGFETTATELAWAVREIGRHPHVAERIREGDSDYLDAVINETMRMRPVLPMVSRVTLEETELMGVRWPKGIEIVPCQYLVHRRPDLYPDPLEFRPERFLEGTPGNFTFVPFGGGVRRCLGASFAGIEMRIVLRTLLSRATVVPLESKGRLVQRRAIALAPADGTRVVLKRRERMLPSRPVPTQEEIDEAVAAGRCPFPHGTVEAA